MRKAVLAAAFTLIFGALWEPIWDHFKPDIFEKESQFVTPIISNISIADLIKWGPTVFLLGVGLAILAIEWVHATRNKKLQRGSLVFETCNIELHRKITTGNITGRFIFKIRNTSSYLLDFEAVIFGDINEVLVNEKHETCYGYIHPGELTTFLSAFAFGVRELPPSDHPTPNFLGTLQYDIKYRISGGKKFFRKTSKTVEVPAWVEFNGQPGTQQTPINFTFSDSEET